MVFSQRGFGFALAAHLYMFTQFRAYNVPAPEVPDHAPDPHPGLHPAPLRAGGPHGRAAAQGAVIVSPADFWLHWPEAYDTRWSTLEIGSLVVALKVEGMAPLR